MSDQRARCIGQMFASMAAMSPEADAIVAGDVTLSRDKLLKVIKTYADRMIREGVKPGDLVSINSGDAIVTVSCVLALSLIGGQFIPFGEELLEEGAPRVTHFFRSMERPPNIGCRENVIDVSWSPKQRSGLEVPQGFPGFLSNDQTCWISPSTGTTGSPKYIAISVDVLNKRIAAIAADYVARPTMLLVLFSIRSRPYIIRAIAALVSGHVLVDSDDFDFAQACGVNVICASPQQIRLWLNSRVIKVKIPILQVSGAKLSDGLVSTLLQSFERIENVYGSNETIKAHITILEGPGEHPVRTYKSGPICVEIVDDHDSPCPIGVSGRVRVKTDYMVDGYLDAPEASAKHFRAGWFYPGDIGVMQPGNLLEILGRTTEIVNIEGQKVSLSDVEAALVGVSGIKRASCFENPLQHAESALAACITLADENVDFDAVETAWLACVHALGASAAPGVILVLPSLEITADGVAKRKKAKETFIEYLSGATPETLENRLFRFRINYNA